ncbi:MAG TPA: response regulator [Xanthomonadaceae bacterium]|nr:response regulator [Xanthomonadaceae bacterium]
MTEHLKPGRQATRSSRSHLLPTDAMVALLAAVMAIVLIAAVTFSSQRDRTQSSARVTATLEILRHMDVLLSDLKDAETGQRGFLLTGEETYLEPYENARTELPGEFQRLATLLADNPAQREKLETVRQLAADKMNELAQTIAVHRSGDPAGALAIVKTSRGKLSMDHLRMLIAEMETTARVTLAQRQDQSQRAETIAVLVTWGGSALLLFLATVAAVLLSRSYRLRETEAWLRTGLIGLGERITGDPALETLGERVLAFTAGYLEAQVGAIYISDQGSTDQGREFRSFATFGIASDAARIVRPVDGLVGQAARDRRAMRVRGVPENYLDVRSGLGRAGSREVLIAPAMVDGVVHAVIELGFFREVEPADEQFLLRASEALAVAVRTARDRSRLEELLDETQRQAEELQAQQEELRVSNEELEEQGRILKESQVQLESQQVELEQTNSQLSEQTQLLENQRDDLTRGQADLSAKAVELTRANRYKSEFLANMSHELRTPLNSTLILAKLLSDNRLGNLTGEQVKFAQTIHSAGNDLLALINDILDLSKIESGNVQINAAPVILESTIEAMRRTFEPMAREKGLQFSTTIESGTPASITTDAQRLEQILRNLISNAIKFTESGEVSLQVGPAPGETIAFSVRDSGIGISTEQQGMIFEAFRQADGSTHRRYGGTGLGLSISRDLARLLGGNIGLLSQPGEGSIFTLMLPVTFAGTAAPSGDSAPDAAAAARDGASRPQSMPARKPLREPNAVADDRNQLRSGTRLILIVEDDARFSSILQDLAHEMGFQCVIAGSANEGLEAAMTYRPSAILLDVNLPDHSGLGVLDQLKHKAATRHIPVHVLSVADYAHEALELGAVGYALKPVKREQIVDALERLEQTFSQQVRRLLVIEDDARQRESLGRLLGNPDVSITAVRTGGQALQQLATTTFDCVVMDLNLPDMSGLELLEKMSTQEDVAFPPVIVYTGRLLTAGEEQALRRYSRSIIVKDARSPERLLDEVTLFLHQVESKLPKEAQRMLQVARDREAALEGKRVLVVEDDVRNVFAVSSVLEPKGVKVEIARNGREALEALVNAAKPGAAAIDLVLMDIMMPEMDGFTAMREIRKHPEWKRLPIIALTAKAMKDDQEKCIAAGANDYIAKPLDVEKLLSLVRVWMPKR